MVSTEPENPAPKTAGRLWQSARCVRAYDRFGPCLGSGGMGSVWAARVSSSGESSGCAGSWVAVKAIPMELGSQGDCDIGGIHSGLRECLSTFRDLSPVYVVRYQSYWLEELATLPQEVRQLCQQRLGRRSSEPTPSQRILPDGPRPAQLQPPATPSAASCSDCTSLRFREGSYGAQGGGACSGGGGPIPISRCPRTSSECFRTASGFGESCGFVWDLPSAAAGRTPSSGASREEGGLTPLGPAACRCADAALAADTGGSPPPLAPSAGPRADAAPTAATVVPSCAVLLIEMELMSDPPDGRSAAATEERLTLRTWLQRPSRTFSDAADVFGSLMLSVRHIHRKRIVHADLKPDNVFCVAERSRVTSVRIGDFGLAGENQQDRQFSYGVLRSSQITGGTPGYVAPEILRAARERSAEVCPSDKVDIYACAVILLELLLLPFRTQMERVDILDRFRNKEAPSNVPEFITSRLPKTRTLLQEMSEHEPAVRPSVEEVCKRFEKEVRKELCRSSTQICCAGSDCARRRQEPAVQSGRDITKEKSGAQGGGGHRRKGRKAGRRGG